MLCSVQHQVYSFCYLFHLRGACFRIFFWVFNLLPATIEAASLNVKFLQLVVVRTALNIVVRREISQTLGAGCAEGSNW